MHPENVDTAGVKGTNGGTPALESVETPEQKAVALQRKCKRGAYGIRTRVAGGPAS